MSDDRPRGLGAVLRVERIRDTDASLALAVAVAGEATARDAHAAAQAVHYRARDALAACLAPDSERPLDLARYTWLAGHHGDATVRLEQAAAEHVQAQQLRQVRADTRVRTKRRCERLAEQRDRLDETAAAAAAARERDESVETWLVHRGGTP